MKKKLYNLNQTIQFYNNRIIYIDKNESKSNKNEIISLIKNSRKNVENLSIYQQCLKNGCLTLEMSQGLKVLNIFDTFSEDNDSNLNFIYEIIFDNKNNKNHSIDELHFMLEEDCKKNNIKFNNIVLYKNKILISFDDKINISYLLKNTSLKFTIKKFRFNLNKQNNEKSNEIDYFYVKFRNNESDEFIKKKMFNYFNNLKIKCNFIIDNDSKKYGKGKIVYYYIPKNCKIDKNKIQGIKIKIKENYKEFKISSKNNFSDFYYMNNFYDFCMENDINIIRIPFYSNNNKSFTNSSINYDYLTFQILNYSVENFKLIKAYLSSDFVQLNQFALFELKSLSNDVFFDNKSNEDLYSYCLKKKCNIKIFYFENKIEIFGAPFYRKKLKNEFVKYFQKLQKEKISYNMNFKEEILLKKYLQKECHKKNIALLIITNNFNEFDVKLEFRKKYYNFITQFLNKNKEKKFDFNYKQKYCEICLDEFSNLNNNNNLNITLKFCGHTFCNECLTLQITNDIINNNLPIKCVKCKNIILNNDIFELFIPGTENYEKIFYYLLKNFYMKNKEKYFWCPSNDCNFLFKNDNNITKNNFIFNLNCPNCNKNICLNCHELIKSDDKNKHNNCKAKLFNKISKEDREYMLKNCKNCPVCFTLYEKINGCNHITCTNCQPHTHFCYICGEILDPKNPFKHFNNKDVYSKCYYRLEDDIKDEDRKDDDLNQEIKKEEEEKKNNDNDNIVNNNVINGNDNENLNYTMMMFNDLNNINKIVKEEVKNNFNHDNNNSIYENDLDDENDEFAEYFMK